jgi:hypothetical protein
MLGAVVVALGLGLVLMVREPPPAPAPERPAAAPAPRGSESPAPASRPRPTPRARPAPLDTGGPPPRPLAVGFDQWTGEEAYTPAELESAARARGVSVSLFKEGRRAYWLTQLTMSWSDLEDLTGTRPLPLTMRRSVARLSTKAHDEAEALLDQTAKRAITEDEARRNLQALESRYLADLSAATGLDRGAIDTLFAPDRVPTR